MTLDAEEYYAVLEAAAGAGIIGGTMCNALLAHCAVKAHAEIIWTWNVQHFQQMSPEIARRTRRP